MNLYVKGKSVLRKTRDFSKNIFPNYDLFYIVEPNWSIEWDGRYITNSLNKSGEIRGMITTSWGLLRDKIIHFGSVNTLISNRGIRDIHPSNKRILTWFHVSPNDPKNQFIPELNEAVDLVHTSCHRTKENLVRHGLKEKKIIVIPLGVDIALFKPEEKQKARKKLNLPLNKIIIGSFQKDGVGWGEGLEPKHVKGPDTFCDVIETLSRQFDLHVLLTGPARGYVKQRLEKAGISYTHKYLGNYLEIPSYYNALDLYLVTSREEGGPKAVLEAMASGVPVVSTKMGMTADTIVDGENGLIAEVDDVNGLVSQASQILQNPILKNKLLTNSLESTPHFSWDRIADQYQQKLYKGSK